jgi:protein TonB
LHRVVLVLGGSLLFNLILLGLATRLSSKGPLPQDITAPLPVQMVQLPPPAPPAEPEEIEPDRPEPPVPSDFIPDLISPSLVTPAAGDIAVRVDMSELGEFDLDGLFVFDETDLDQVPHALAKPQPIYPYQAQQMEIEGWVTVRFLVGTDGTVSQVTAMGASPEGLFEDSVLRTVPHWRFSPGMIAGKAVPSWVENTIRFELH